MITVEQLYFRYPKNRRDTLRDINFTVQKGEVFGFLGPSGAGKSTLQKILTGTLTGFKGKAHVLERPMTSQNDSFYEHIGVDFEFPNFYEKFTARENLQYFASLYTKIPIKAHPLLEQMGLINHVDKQVSGFSKGMKTRLAFIRCLLHDPELLFLDEPTSGLDPSNARILKDMVIDLQNAGKTIILTTHNMHDAEELCDRVAFIVDGEIRALDTPSAFRATTKKVDITYSFKGENGQEHEERLPLADLGDNGRFLTAAKERKITRIHSREPSLEDIFISITGRRLQ